MTQDSSFDYTAARANLLAREKEQARSRHERYTRAQAEAAAIIDMIKTRFRPVRILLWGSLLHPEEFDEHSDIDIAVEGINGAKEWFDLYGAAMNMASFPLDLVEMESIDRQARESIRTYGKVVYERQ